MQKKLWTMLVVALFGITACADTGDDEGALDEGSLPREDTVADSANVPTEKTPGSETRAGTGPTIISKNVAYTLTLPFTAPHAGPITSIHYSWGLSYKPAGLTVLLCRQTTSNCVNITASQAATTYFFNNQTSNVPFILHFSVSGSGAMSPAYGQNDQIIINHS